MGLSPKAQDLTCLLTVINFNISISGLNILHFSVAFNCTTGIPELAVCSKGHLAHFPASREEYSGRSPESRGRRWGAEASGCLSHLSRLTRLSPKSLPWDTCFSRMLGPFMKHMWPLVSTGSSSSVEPLRQRIHCLLKYLPVCCSLCPFLFSPSWISSQMVPQPQCRAQLPGESPRSWPHHKPGASWSCGKELAPVVPLQLEPEAGGASSASIWGWRGMGGEASSSGFSFFSLNSLLLKYREVQNYIQRLSHSNNKVLIRAWRHWNPTG